MLRLRFADSRERAPGVPALDDQVHVWRNRHGGVVAYGFEQDGARWMHWPEISATFRFSSGDAYVTAFPARAGSTTIIWDIFRRTVLPMALQANGFEALHASAVMSGSSVVAFCAASETGKSTLAYGLSRKGFPEWADDGVVFRMDEKGPVALPLPFEVRLRPDARHIFGDEAPVSTRFQDNGPGDQRHQAPAPFATIGLLSRAAAGTFAGSARIRALKPAEAFPAVLVHAHEFNPFNVERRARMLQTYLELVAIVPILSIEFVPRHDDFHSLLNAIAEILGQAVPASSSPLCIP